MNSAILRHAAGAARRLLVLLVCVAGLSSVASQAATAGDPSEARRLADLFYELQLLQQEVRELRGLVEQQAHQIKRMARDQQEQYIDLDRRLSSAGPGVGARTGSAGAASATATAPANSAGSKAERDAYTSAFNLMKEQQFDASTRAFNQLIVDHPNGAYTANAFYWLGELHLAKTQYEKARQSFAQVTNLYPDHQKVPDALYKLGVVYHRLGDTQRSLEFLSRVRNEHPQSSAAGLAQTYAAELR